MVACRMAKRGNVIFFCSRSGKDDEGNPWLDVDFVVDRHHPLKGCVVPRSIALSFFAEKWDSYLHIGVVPQRPEILACTVGGDCEAKRHFK